MNIKKDGFFTNEGGLYILNNQVKRSKKNKPLLSIITVVYNSDHLIEKTILSVKSQTYENIEYIIIDGNSSDNTLEIIKKYNQFIDYWMSEPDNGLYDAMNKGIIKANGDYLWFLNSGDLIFSNNTVEEIFFNFLNADIYYGETMMIDANGENIGMRRLKTPENLNWKSLKKGMVICHQAIIVKSTIVADYDVNFKFSADFDWVLRALKQSKQITNTRQIVAKYLQEGLSRKNIKNSLIERYKIMVKNYGLIPTIFNHFIISIKFFYFLLRNRRF
jgi:glycosyltransferase involved in cell wall biosynthesis